MENSINGKNQKSSENLRIFNNNVSLHTAYQTQCFRNEDESFDEMIDSTCSSPYVSAPSSPGSNRGHNGYFFSAPASPMHYIQSKSIPVSASAVNISSSGSFEFDFSAKDNSISTADELFLNGQIRPMKLSSHLQKPQILTPLIDLEIEEEDEENEESVFLKREGRLRNGSIHRRTRSLSPLRSSQSPWHRKEEQEEELEEENKHTHSIGEDEEEEESTTTTPSDSASTSRSSSTSSRNSKRWVFLKDFLRSKSEGRGNYSKEKFWNSISSFNPVKDKKQSISSIPVSNEKEKITTTTTTEKKKPVPAKKTVKPINGIGKRRKPAPSAHEMLYTSNRAQAEEMKRKTYLPYRQGLLGCLGFSSKGYGAMNVFARSLNTTVSSR